MHPNAILHEIQQLYNVSDRLDSVMVATKMAPVSGLEPASA
jgi:hypothetical protein